MTVVREVDWTEIVLAWPFPCHTITVKGRIHGHDGREVFVMTGCRIEPYMTPDHGHEGITEEQLQTLATLALHIERQILGTDEPVPDEQGR